MNILFDNVFSIFLAFLLFGFILSLLPKRKLFSIVIIVAFFILALIDFFSLTIIDRHINFFMFFDMDEAILRAAPYVMPESFVPLCIIFLILIPIIILILKYKKYLYSLPDKKRLKIFLIMFCVSFPLFLSSQTTAAYANFIKDTAKYIFDSSKYDQSIYKNDKYVFPKDIKAEKGKNLVIIYVESLENSLLNKKFKKFIPNIQKLIDKGWYQYTNYNEGTGSNKTIKALYSTQTSFPCFLTFVGWGKSPFSYIKDLNITSWSKVLEKAGYKNVFLSADKTNFEHKEQLMSAFGYDVKNDLLPKNNDGTFWEGHDTELFEEAKKQYLELSKQEPFNLTILTVDTHFPHGYPDARMREKITENIKDDHKFTFACADYLLGDFIDFIYKQPNIKDTVVVILGDHLLMGAFKSPLYKEFRNSKRSVMLLTNKKIVGFEKDSPISYYDMPKIILDLLEVKHNAVFSKDLIPEMSERFTLKNYALFKNFNTKTIIENEHK